MDAPTLALGSRNTPAASLATVFTEGGTLDNGADFVARARTVRWSPAGVTSDVIFDAALLTVRCTEPCTLTVRGYVDGVAIVGRTVTIGVATILPAAPVEQVILVDVPLSLPLMVDGVEMGRVAARGTWAQIEVEITSASGIARIDDVEVEYDVLSRGVPAVGAA